MSTAPSTELCRITVIGPVRKVDLAVPTTTTVAALLPLLVRHTTDGRPGLELADRAWVLQRLGQEPFDLTGTAESHDWLEGEELYLRPATDPLPDLDFDDLADGVATVVNRRGDRWRPEYRRVLFLLLSAAAMAVLGAVLVGHGPAGPQVAAGGAIAAVFLTAALVCGRQLPDGAFSLLFGCGAAGFAALAAAVAADAPRRLVPDGPAVLAAAVAAVAVVAVLLLAGRTFAPHLPWVPLLVIGVTGLAAVLVALLRGATGLTMQRTGGTAAVLIFAVVVLAPRLAVKFSRLRGPQLPKTSEDMSYDIEPATVEGIKRRTDDAEAYLTAAMVTAALVLPVLFDLTVGFQGWAGWTLVLLCSCAILLRARAFLGVWQRGALVVAGSVGVVMVIVRLAGQLWPTARWALLGVLLALLLPLVLSALRPWPRRMLPFWEYAATFFDVATGIALLPVLAQLLGLYGWARGLFG